MFQAYILIVLNILNISTYSPQEFFYFCYSGSKPWVLKTSRQLCVGVKPNFNSPFFFCYNSRYSWLWGLLNNKVMGGEGRTEEGSVQPHCLHLYFGRCLQWLSENTQGLSPLAPKSQQRRIDKNEWKCFLSQFPER